MTELLQCDDKRKNMYFSGLGFIFYITYCFYFKIICILKMYYIMPNSIYTFLIALFSAMPDSNGLGVV